MAENYPVVQLIDGSGNVYDARTFNWNSTNVATGSTSESVQFALPAGLLQNSFSLSVIADGIASDTMPFTTNVEIYAASAGSPNTFILSLDGTGTNLQLLDGNNNVLVSQPLATTTGVTVIGQNGVADSLTIDYANGYFNVPVSFNGGDLGGGNALTIQNGSFTTETYSSSGAHAGTIYLDGNLISYANVTALTNKSTAANVLLQMPGSNNTITLQDDGTQGNGLSELVSAGTFPPTIFADPTTSLTLNAPAGTTNKITVSGTAPPVDFNAALTIAGNSGSDTVAVNGSLSLGHNGGNTGALSITAQTITVGANLTVGSLTLAHDGSVTLSSNISKAVGGTGILTEKGPGTATINGAFNNFVSAAVNGGTLVLGNTNAAGEHAQRHRGRRRRAGFRRDGRDQSSHDLGHCHQRDRAR